MLFVAFAESGFTRRINKKRGGETKEGLMVREAVLAATVLRGLLPRRPRTYSMAIAASSGALVAIGSHRLRNKQETEVAGHSGSE